MPRKIPQGEPVIKKYKVLTPIKVDDEKRLEEGETFEADENEVADLVDVGAIVET
jgi:hypothetical protein